jgi:hypothetical protein
LRRHTEAVSNSLTEGIRTIADVRNLELKVRCPSEEKFDALIAQARSAGAVYVIVQEAYRHKGVGTPLMQATEE